MLKKRLKNFLTLYEVFLDVINGYVTAISRMDSLGCCELVGFFLSLLEMEMIFSRIFAVQCLFK